jgi:hypothetical protein
VKLTLQIALGVFIGTLASRLIIDSWHTHQENRAQLETEKLRIEREKVRKDQGERIRKLLLENRQSNPPNPKKLPDDFVPDDAKAP